MFLLNFESIQIGDVAEFTKTILKVDLDTFIALTSDTNPIHTDEMFAASTPFKSPIVHGMLTASLLSALIGNHLPGPGAVWYEQEIRFPSPVRVGETLRITGKVLQKSLSLRVLIIETLIFGEDGRRVLEGKAKVKMF